MWYRARQSFTFHDQVGRPIEVRPGQLVDVYNAQEAARLVAECLIVPPEYSHTEPAVAACAAVGAHVRRVGIWMKTTEWHSGGRLYVWQYAWCLAAAGWDVYLVTNRRPKWMVDYPDQPRVHVAIDGENPVPADLDLIVGDNKGNLSDHALEHRARHCPTVPFVAFNFETPNWAEASGMPKLAALMSHGQYRHVQAAATVSICCSDPGARYLAQWCHHAVRTVTLPPAVNDYAVDAHPEPLLSPDRPYAVWCARGDMNKRLQDAITAVWAAPDVLDLAVVGHVPGDARPADTDRHRLIERPGLPDPLKFSLFRHARVAIAPSLFEGFGMVPAEALAVGTPAVVYDLPVLRWAYGDRLTYVPWGDAKALGQTVAELAGTPKPDRSRDQAWVRRTYGLAAMGDRVERIPYHAAKRTSVTAHMIAYWGRSAPEAIASVYDHVDQVVVAYGPVEHCRHVAPDGTLERLQAMDDPDHKIVLESRDSWPDKLAMRRWVSRQAEGNYQLILDADEIWHGLDAWIDARLDGGTPRWVHFWHTLDWWIHGARWGERVQPFGTDGPHYRWSWWRPSYGWINHSWPCDAAGRGVCDVDTNRAGAARVPETVIYHLGHAMPRDVMQAKWGLYAARDGRGVNDARAEWEAFENRPGPCAGGAVERVTWTVPELVRRAADALSNGVEAAAGVRGKEPPVCSPGVK